ncbi:MAG: hypothetical protein M9938_10615 [Solirubrobacterales bacterium]|nr:hypothetical protein [Solirubrobacterales bacterium]
MSISPRPDRSRLESFLASDPVCGLVRTAAGDDPVYLVGGAIRDALCGYPVDDLDLVTESDPARLIEALDPAARVHERFGTAELRAGGFPVDLARARTERYPRPGALPEVSFGTITDDLDRRDFTVNSMAVCLNGPDRWRLLDPHDGFGDLQRGLIRVLHPASFRDDPTRAIRAARYAARFGFGLAGRTAELIRATDFTTISADRLRAELLLVLAEPDWIRGFGLLSEWGVIRIEPARLLLAERAAAVLASPLWAGSADRGQVLLAACFDPPDGALAKLIEPPSTPFGGLRKAESFGPVELILARASGADWLDLWRREWSAVRPEVSGQDLLRAGVPEGPLIGKGIEAALQAKLDRGVSGREVELEVALAAVEGDRADL